MEALRQHNPSAKVIYTGTRGQYGPAVSLPVNEDAPTHPKGIYEISNLTAEKIIQVYNDVHGIESVLLRLTNTYGPRAQMKHHRYGVVNWFVRLAIDDETIKVFGDGKILRDFLYIDDAVEAILMSALAPEAVGEVLNVGIDKPTDFVELADTLIEVAGSGRWKFAPFSPERKAQEPGDFYSDISKIRRLVGWEPRTSLREGLRKPWPSIERISGTTGGTMATVDIHPTVQRAANLSILGNLTLKAGVEVGANVIFYPDVVVGENSRILPGAVIGRPPIRVGTTNRPIEVADHAVQIGAGCIIGANSVLYCNLNIGERVLIGDLASIREGCRLGDDSVLGRGVMMMYDTCLGERSRVIDGAIITGNMQIEADVFIGPGVSTVNDNDVYLKRYGLIPFAAAGPILRRFALIGTGATIGAEVEIGMGAIVAPGAMVTQDVPPWTIVAGVPAREMRRVDEQARLQILQRFGLTDSEGE